MKLFDKCDAVMSIKLITLLYVKNTKQILNTHTSHIYAQNKEKKFASKKKR